MSSLKGVCTQFGQSLNDILVTRDIHDGDTRDFTNSAFEVFIASSHNVAFVLHDTLYQAVISICTLVRARQTFESRVSCNPIITQCELELQKEFFFLKKKTYCNAMRYFGPNFSNSANTQSVIHGMAVAYQL